MQVETLTAHGEAYYGKIAVLPKEDQHHWIPQDGDLNRLKFYKKNEQENKWDNLTIAIGDIHEKSAEEILRFFKSLKAKDSISMDILKSNSWDELIEYEQGTTEKDFFEFVYNKEFPEKIAYIFDTYQGDFTVYRTKHGFQCWSGDELQEKKFIEKKTVQQIEIQKDTEFVIEAADKIVYTATNAFVMEKGIYYVNIGFDEDSSPILLEFEKANK